MSSLTSVQNSGLLSAQSLTANANPITAPFGKSAVESGKLALVHFSSAAMSSKLTMSELDLLVTPLRDAEARLQKTSNMAAVSVESSLEKMTELSQTLLNENSELRQQIVAFKSQETQEKTALLAEIEALKAQAAVANKTVEEMREKMTETALKAEQQITAALNAGKDAVRLAIDAGNAKVAAMEVTKNADIEYERMMRNNLQISYYHLQTKYDNTQEVLNEARQKLERRQAIGKRIAAMTGK